MPSLNKREATSNARPRLHDEKYTLPLLPRTVINCPSTLAKRVGESLARYHVGDRVWQLDTGHDLMITEPEKTAEMLLRLC